MELTMKSTKQQIYDAYNEVKQQLDGLAALKENPVLQAENAKKKQDADVAASLIQKDILSDDIKKEYQALCSTIEDMKKKIKDLYDIEVEANTLVCLINAHKDQEHALKEKYNDLKLACEKEYKTLIDGKNNEIKELEDKKKDILDSTLKENIDLKNKLVLERKREEEEYKYNLKRERKIEEDKWTDEKKKREQDLSERENEVQKQTDDVNMKADYIVELENEVEKLKADVQLAYESGVDAGKKDADKSNAFEVRALKSKHEAELQILQTKFELETKRADKAELEVVKTNEKLDQAYAQMRQLASETVKSSGGVKILNSDNSNK